MIGVGGASLLFKNFNKLLALYTSALGGADVRLFVVESQRGVNASAWPLLAGSLAAISADAGAPPTSASDAIVRNVSHALLRAPGGYAAADQKVRLLYTEGAGNFYYQSRTYDFGGDLPDPWYVVVVQRIDCEANEGIVMNSSDFACVKVRAPRARATPFRRARRATPFAAAERSRARRAL